MAARMRSRLIPASVALPFHNRQRRRSTSPTITAFAAARSGPSGDKPPATCVRCCNRMARWNQSKIGSSAPWCTDRSGWRRGGSLTVWFTDEAIVAWRAEPRTTPGGQPWYSPLAILTALTLRAVFRIGLRQTEGLIGSILRLLGLTLRVPDHTTLSRRAATLDVPRPRPRREGAAVHLLVDSTGLKLCGAGEWLAEKHGTSKRRSWKKLHIGMEAGTGRIVAVVLTDGDADDGAQAGPLLDQADG